MSKTITDLEKSAGEELKAAYDYRERAAFAREHGDVATAELYEHIAKEEDKHYEEFMSRARKIECGPQPKKHKPRMVRRIRVVPPQKISIIR